MEMYVYTKVLGLTPNHKKAHSRMHACKQTHSPLEYPPSPGCTQTPLSTHVYAHGRHSAHTRGLMSQLYSSKGP